MQMPAAAGVVVLGPTAEVPLQVVRDAFDVNVLALLGMCQAVVPHMARQGSGRILNIGSLTGFTPVALRGIYSATKGAVMRLTDALRVELRPLGVQVRAGMRGEWGVLAQHCMQGAHMSAPPAPAGDAGGSWIHQVKRTRDCSGASQHEQGACILVVVCSTALAAAPPSLVAWCCLQEAACSYSNFSNSLWGNWCVHGCRPCPCAAALAFCLLAPSHAGERAALGWTCWRPPWPSCWWARCRPTSTPKTSWTWRCGRTYHGACASTLPARALAERGTRTIH